MFESIGQHLFLSSVIQALMWASLSSSRSLWSALLCSIHPSLLLFCIMGHCISVRPDNSQFSMVSDKYLDIPQTTSLAEITQELLCYDSNPHLRWIDRKHWLRLSEIQFFTFQICTKMLAHQQGSGFSLNNFGGCLSGMTEWKRNHSTRIF